MPSTACRPLTGRTCGRRSTSPTASRSSRATPARPTNPAVTPVSEIAGAAKAACAYIAALQEIRQFAGHAGDTVIAGVFTHPNPAYLKPYAALLATALPGALYPATWAVHDYDDVTASYAGPPSTDLKSFDHRWLGRVHRSASVSTVPG